MCKHESTKGVHTPASTANKAKKKVIPKHGNQTQTKPRLKLPDSNKEDLEGNEGTYTKIYCM